MKYKMDRVLLLSISLFFLAKSNILRCSLNSSDYIREDKIHFYDQKIIKELISRQIFNLNPYPTAFPYGNGMVLHFYQQQESSTTKTVHKVINKGLKTYV